MTTNKHALLFYHIIFSTKRQQNFIDKKIEKRVWAHIGKIAKKNKLTAIQIGGIENHIHALVMSPADNSPGQIAEWLKDDSSKWINEEFKDLKDFGWQDGYGAFSVSKSKVPDVLEYIKNQRRHHQGRSFEDEYSKLLKLYEIEFDEEKLFD